MATYAEIFDLRNNKDGLKNKIQVAVAIKAHAFLILATPTQAQKDWAMAALADPDSKTEEAMWWVFSANKSATADQITQASDATIQTAVDAYADGVTV